MNIISISTAPSNQLVGKPFYDLYATLEVMQKLWAAAVFNGFEFQNVAEWDAENPPRDEGERRLAYWTDSQKYTIDQIATFLGGTGLPVHSVHANRDVGIYLCSGQPEAIDVGRRLIRESLSLAEQAGASVCVFHLWDTWKEDFDTAFVHDTFTEIAAQHPSIKASVENAPTQLQGATPFDLAREYDWITLDLRWAALYDELDRFAAVKDRIANVVMGSVPGAAEELQSLVFLLVLMGIAGIFVIVVGALLGGHFLKPVMAIEEGLLKVINGEYEYRFDVKSAEVGGLSYRINQLIGVLMGEEEEDEEE